jgi:hypothetical protein
MRSPEGTTGVLAAAGLADADTRGRYLSRPRGPSGLSDQIEIPNRRPIHQLAEVRVVEHRPPHRHLIALRRDGARCRRRLLTRPGGRRQLAPPCGCGNVRRTIVRSDHAAARQCGDERKWDAGSGLHGTSRVPAALTPASPAGVGLACPRWVTDCRAPRRSGVPSMTARQVGSDDVGRFNPPSTSICAPSRPISIAW